MSTIPLDDDDPGEPSGKLAFSLQLIACVVAAIVLVALATLLARYYLT